MNRSAITGFIVALAMGGVALDAVAQQRASFWPRLQGKATPFVEWYSDVPWHQKLGTFAGNEIDVPLIMPYETLPAETQKLCTDRKMSQEQCMIEGGVINIIGYRRVDTLYDPTESKIQNAPECKAPYKCTEVRLEVSNHWVRNNSSQFVLEPMPYGRRYNLGPTGNDYGGFVITDGSTYAPQMLWEMSHYCDSQWAKTVDMQDAVCYADYFSPMNNGYNIIPKRNMDQWPASIPWSVWPVATAPPSGLNQCPEKDTKCVFAMAGFAMSPVPLDPTKLQENKYNVFLMDWFKNAQLAFPADLTPDELQRHFPWSGKAFTWAADIYPRAVQNPFLGAYATTNSYPAADFANCDTTPTGPTQSQGCTKAPTYQSDGYAYPRQCTLDDLAAAVAGSTSADKLRQCGLNYEIHPNGWVAQWPTKPIDYQAIVKVAPFNYLSNQYGRTSFLFAGVPGMQMPVSFFKDPTSISGLSLYEQAHNASLFSLFLPAANIADVKRQMDGREYADTAFYHTLLMSNHMESDPTQFAEGMRGKVLWHNEYRMQPMYNERNKHTWLADRMFDAAFDPLKSKYDPAKAPAPFHNNTCDGCHVRNGSGIPIKPDYTIDANLSKFMKNTTYYPFANGVEKDKDYTFTGAIRPMKLVFFDLQVARGTPQKAGGSATYFNNKIMNFYGDSFHVTPPGAVDVFNYSWYYENADIKRMVVGDLRKNSELKDPYQPRQIKLESFTTPLTCQIFTPVPTPKAWPASCTEVNGAAILAAANASAVGYMLLNGKRLGNLSAIESIPNSAIMDFRKSQVAKLGPLGPVIAGEIAWSNGARDGVGVQGQKKLNCVDKTITNCFIGRFGWTGDRVSLEDQVANAAFVEMNITTKSGYETLYGKNNPNVASPIRYLVANCGPANKTCLDSPGNSDLDEGDVKRMADYARWLGNPTRSEVQLSLPETIAGEKIFRKLECDTCHVIKRINIIPDETMLTSYFRARLKTHIGGANQPFLSYIGTDLLMHDMGYLSQTGNSSQSIRDPVTGVVKPGFETYVQKIRTPPLKGLRFNNYVTDAHRNVVKPGDPGCDFLLHDGRACDAMEAAFLHDGPAIKKLKIIEGLNGLTGQEPMQLRAFLYSL